MHSFIMSTDRLHDDNWAILYSWPHQNVEADGDDVMIMMRTTEYLVITSSLYGNNFIMCNFVVIFIAVVVVVAIAIRQIINATIAVWSEITVR